MVILECRLVGKRRQYAALDEAIRTTQFIRNKCVRYWRDTRDVTPYDLNKYCAILACEYAFVRTLNSMARQAAAERAGAAITRFYKNCREKKPRTGAGTRPQLGRHHSEQGSGSARTNYRRA